MSVLPAQPGQLLNRSLLSANFSQHQPMNLYIHSVAKYNDILMMGCSVSCISDPDNHMASGR